MVCQGSRGCPATHICSTIVLQHFSLNRVFNVFHVSENKVPVVALQSFHKLHVAADLKTLDRFLLQTKRQ